jgi:hypothetical protein
MSRRALLATVLAAALLPWAAPAARAADGPALTVDPSAARHAAEQYRLLDVSAGTSGNAGGDA